MESITTKANESRLSSLINYTSKNPLFMIDEKTLIIAIENLNKSVDSLTLTLTGSMHIGKELKKDIQELIGSMNKLSNDLQKAGNARINEI